MIDTKSHQPAWSVISQDHKQEVTSKKKSGLINISTWIMIAAIFLLPVLAVPLTTSFIIHSKIYLILFSGILLFTLYFLDSFRNKVWRIILSPLILPLVFFVVATTLSTFLTQNYPVKNLLGYGGVYLTSALIAIIGASLVDQKKARWAANAFVGAICLLNITSLLQLLGIGPSHLVTAITGFEMDHTILFNLAGGSFIALQLGIMALVGVIAKIFSSKKINTFEVIALPLLVFGVGLHLWSILPGQIAQTPLPSFAVSWSVALDSLRVPKAALIGQGPEGYLNTFSRYRPASLNTSPFWQIRFDSGLGAPLTLLVQMGLVGVISWLFLAGKFASKSMKNSTYKSSPLTWIILTSFVLQFFLPLNLLIVGLQGFLLAFWTAQHKDQFAVLNLRALSASLDKNQSTTLNEQKTQADNWISLGTNGLLVAGLLFLALTVGRTYAGFHHLYLAEKGLANNDVVAYYENGQKAMVNNQYLDSIRRYYALTNFRIALALSEKTDLTEQEQQQITELVSQAVREAQAATTIDPQDAQNWMTLAEIYQELINSVDEADQWAVNAYVSAIQADPSNPIIRIQLGNILLQQEQIQQAANLFSQAVELKPDLASGHFYLGQVYRLAQDPITAKSSWQQALALLEPGTEDYQMLESLLEELQPEVEAAETQLAQQQEMSQQYDQDGQPISQEGLEGFVPESDEQSLEPGTSPLGQQLPSLTDQNIESRESIVSQPGTSPLELSDDVEMSTQEE